MPKAIENMPEAAESIANFFWDERFLVPFLATVGASLTMVLLQFISRYVNDHRKKLYATNYISNVCLIILKSSLILKKHTIGPHIEAMRKILSGNNKLLHDMFLRDEFDILIDKQIEFGHLSEEYKVLLGYDDIMLVQAFDTLNYLITNEKANENLNMHVKNYLKSAHDFADQPPEKQRDILNTYEDHLGRVNHRTNVTVFFVCRIIIPSIKNYIRGRQFCLFSTRGVEKIIEQIEEEEDKHRDIIPEEDFMEKTKTGGIQNAL